MLMRWLILPIAICLTASACTSYTQREATEAKADEAWCATLGIQPGDARFADCQIAAAQRRKPRSFALPASPTSSPIPCTLYGVDTGCTWAGQNSLPRY